MSEVMLKKYIGQLLAELPEKKESISDYIQKLSHLIAVVGASLEFFGIKDENIEPLAEKVKQAMVDVYKENSAPIGWMKAFDVHRELTKLIFRRNLVEYSDLYNFQTKLNEKWMRREGS